MMPFLRLAAITLLFMGGGLVAWAQTTPGAVVENSRDGRQVRLTLRSGPHPLPGDYPVTVYLPPNYEADTATYPVFFTFDAFDPHPEHDVLVQENLIQPAIFVAIANKTSDSRSYDLTPSWTGPNTGGLEAFADLITRELKPYLDTRFRTRPEPASTGVIGISLGGLAACWLGYVHPETFGMAACLEPSLWWNGNQLLNRLLGDTAPKFATRFWIMAADQEYVSMWQNAKIAANALRQRGWREGVEVAFCQVHNFPHNWEAVRTQARSMLHFFLRHAPAELVGAELTNCHGPQLVPLRPSDLGGAAYAYLDLRFRHDLRTTAINPTLEVADPRVVQLSNPVLGRLTPLASGWTTVSTTYDGFRAVIDVQGYSFNTAAEPPPRPAPPTIVEQPSGTTVAPGKEAILVVTATGEGTLAYQWRRDGADLPGATGAVLTLPDFSVAQTGDYMVIVTNLSGSTASGFARLDIPPMGPRIVTPPTSRSVVAGDDAALAVVAAGNSSLSYQWFRNGHAVTGATSSALTIPAITPADAGIYDCAVSGGGDAVSPPAVVGVLPPAGVRTAGAVTTRPEWQNIRHPNGHTYDQFLLTGPAGSFTADPAEIARLSFLDENESIVQVELSGAGAITVVLENPAGPMAPALYNQSAIAYMRGRATLVLAGADATTHFTIYSVGPANNPGVARPDVPYAGWAEVAVAGIVSADGGLGGIHQGNVSFATDRGYAGLVAPTVARVAGQPVVVHDIAAAGSALPYLYFGATAQVQVKVAGGGLGPPPGGPLGVTGVGEGRLEAGQDSTGAAAPAQAIRARLVDADGVDVTALLVAGP